MPYHSYRLLVDWSGNGQFNVNAASDENVTADLIGGIRARAGIDYGQVFPQAIAGRASFTLRNDHRRYSGYDTGNTLGSGLLRGVLLQVWCAANTAFGGTGAYLPIWGGVVDYIQYGTSPSGLDTAEIHCVGNLASMQDARVDLSITSASIASIGTDIATAVWPSTRVQDTGNATFRYIMASGNPRHRYYLETSNSPTITGYIYEGRALAGLRSLAQDTGSRLYEGPEGAVRLYSTAAQSSLESGAARFTLRHTSTGTSASTYHVSAATPEIARRDVINQVSVSYITTRRQSYTSYNAYGNSDADRTDFANFARWSRFSYGDGTGGVRPGDFVDGTVHGVGTPSARIEYTYTVALPRFERNDPTPGVQLVSVDRFSLREFAISIPITYPSAQQASAIRYRSGYTGPQHITDVFRWRGSQNLTPGTEFIAQTSSDRLGFDWAANSASQTASTMRVRLLMTTVSMHEYTLTVRLENLHPDVITSPTVPSLQNLRILLTGWTVQDPPKEVTHTRTDTTSVSQWGLQSYAADVPWITTESQAQTYAQQVLDARAQPVTRYRVSYVLDQKASLTDIPQVSDIVDLEYRGTTTKCWVDSARHDISRRRHLCELLLTPV